MDLQWLERIAQGIGRPFGRAGVPVLAALSLVGLIALAGCGGSPEPASQEGSSGGASAPGSPSSPPAPAAGEAPAEPVTPIPVTIGYSAVSGAFTPLWVAKEAGLFEKYGLQVGELQYVASGSKIAQAMIGGDLNFGGIGSAVIDANVAGSDLVYVSGLVGQFVFSLYSKPELNTLEDLRGRVAAATQKGSSTDNALRKLLLLNNMEPDKDVQITFVGGVPEVMAAVEQGVADAGVVSPPTTLKARQAGLKELVNITDQKIPFTQSAIATQSRWAKENPEAVRRLVQAIGEAIHVIKTDPETTKEVLAKYTKTEDAEILDETYNAFVGAFADVPRMTREELLADIELSEQARGKDVKPEQFYDPSAIDALEAEGFFQQLGK